MAIFAILGSNSPSKVEASIKQNFEDYMALGNGQWLVSDTKATTQEVSTKIGDKGENGTFIVIPVSNYWGTHYASTWEWIEKKGS